MKLLLYLILVVNCVDGYRGVSVSVVRGGGRFRFWCWWHMCKWTGWYG